MISGLEPEAAMVEEKRERKEEVSISPPLAQEEKKKLFNAFIYSCPLHNHKRGTCEEGDICDGDCKYVVKFVNIINESNKG